MRRTFLAIIVGLSAALWLAQPASAITNGTEDTSNAYANVGAMMWRNSGGDFEGLCSGTLLAAGSYSRPAQFLTAGHCTAGLAALGIPPSDVFVSFDAVGPMPIGVAPDGFPLVDPTGVKLVPATAYVTNPAYPAGQSPSGYDLGVITLAGQISNYYNGLTPVTLPPAGLLTPDLNGKFVVGVGYGMQAKSPKGVAWTGVRNVAPIKIAAVQPNYLHTSENANATGGGGACGGDSGGPLFYRGFEVSVITWGAARCGTEGMGPRLDRPAIQDWLSQFTG